MPSWSDELRKQLVWTSPPTPHPHALQAMWCPSFHWSQCFSGWISGHHYFAYFHATYSPFLTLFWFSLIVIWGEQRENPLSSLSLSPPKNEGYWRRQKAEEEADERSRVKCYGSTYRTTAVIIHLYVSKSKCKCRNSTEHDAHSYGINKDIPFKRWEKHWLIFSLQRSKSCWAIATTGAIEEEEPVFFTRKVPYHSKEVGRSLAWIDQLPEQACHEQTCT